MNKHPFSSDEEDKQTRQRKILYRMEGALITIVVLLIYMVLLSYIGGWF